MSQLTKEAEAVSSVHACNLCEGTDLLALIDFGKQPVVKHYLTDPMQEEPTFGAIWK
jgi:hypothetical protein